MCCSKLGKTFKNSIVVLETFKCAVGPLGKSRLLQHIQYSIWFLQISLSQACGNPLCNSSHNKEHPFIADLSLILSYLSVM